MSSLDNASLILPRTVFVGGIPIGGAHPVSVQTMLSGRYGGKKEELQKKIKRLENLGCDILRVAVPDMKSIDELEYITTVASMPLVADIHFDYKIALAVMDRNISKLRINPGNLGPEWKTLEVLRKAKDKNIPVRVGINGGSLPEELKDIEDKASAMLLAAEKEIEIMEKVRFDNAIFSLKASDIETTCRVNRLFVRKYRYPLHLGITEAGPLIDGVVKSSIAFSRLLTAGIGSTIRVSLTDSEENEVIAGRTILTSLGMAVGTTIVSCPRCGRSTFDTHAFIEEYGERIRSCGKEITVAIMGCTVNGPGEASSADLGITGSGKHVILFKHGEVIGTYPHTEAGKEFLKELDKL